MTPAVKGPDLHHVSGHYSSWAGPTSFSSVVVAAAMGSYHPFVCEGRQPRVDAAGGWVPKPTLATRKTLW